MTGTPPPPPPQDSLCHSSRVEWRGREWERNKFFVLHSLYLKITYLR